MRPISLHHIVAPEVGPAELVRIAAELGCAHVCLFTYLPAQSTRFRAVGDVEARELSTIMNDHGISAYGITSFAIEPGVDIALYATGLDRGACLSARYASVRIPAPRAPGVADAFGRFAELAEEFGITPSIEVTGFNNVGIVADTLTLVEQVGAGTLTVDPLHMVRTGALDIYRRLAPTGIGYVQLCDGPREATEQQYWHESAAERLPPGEGEFPLAEIMAMVPDGQPVSTEVPSERLRSEGVSAFGRASRVVAATRTFLAGFEPV